VQEKRRRCARRPSKQAWQGCRLQGRAGRSAEAPAAASASATAASPATATASCQRWSASATTYAELGGTASGGQRPHPGTHAYLHAASSAPGLRKWAGCVLGQVCFGYLRAYPCRHRVLTPFPPYRLSGNEDLSAPALITAGSALYFLAAVGISFGVLSASWDPQRKGSALGLDEVGRNAAALADRIPFLRSRVDRR
jgi:hypothetical protein